MTLTTFTSRAAAAMVAAVAGIISYGHIRSVALTAGESDLAAVLLPLGVDGLIVVATLAMLEDKRQGRTRRWSANAALVFGIAATIAGNIASAEPTTTARVVAAIPAVSFLLSVEVLVRSGRRKSTHTTAPVVSTTAAVAVDTTAPAVSTTPAGAVDTDPARKATNTARPVPRKRTGGRQPTAERVAAAVARRPDITPAEVAARLKVSERTVQRHWPTPHPRAADDTAAAPNGRVLGEVK